MEARYQLKKKCEACETEFSNKSGISAPRFAARAFCSYKCRASILPPPRQDFITAKTCITCGKEFFRKGAGARRLARFCSQSCSSKGVHHWNWQGGITPALHLIRHSPEYNDWRKAVYRRDRWTCQVCGEKQRHPIAHHIFDFRSYPDLRFDISNGQTLCRACHKWVHSSIGMETRYQPMQVH